MRGSFTVLFEDPFWVGVAEREDDDGVYEVARVVFGSEPTPAELYQWSLEEFARLEYRAIDARGATAEAVPAERRNPKRAQREAVRAAEQRGLTTRAQEALRVALEERKVERKASSRAQREAEAARRFALRQEKRKQKHRGH